MLFDKSVRDKKKSVKSACKGKKPVKATQSITAATDYNSLRADYTYDNYEYLSPEDCLDNFAYNYSNSSDYVADAIGEQADSSVDIYNSDLCKSCWDIYQSGAYEEAKSNGLLDGADSLMNLLQACQYEFYSGVLYENLDAVMRNLVLEYLESEAIDVTEDQWDEICDDILTDIDNNDRISDICERVEEFLQGDEDEDEEDEDIEESVRAKGRKSVKASRKTNRKPVKASKLRKGKNRKAVTAAKLTVSFDEFKPWSGAVDTWNNLMDFGKIDLLEQIIDDTYYNEEAGEAILSETELNDLLWFEPETVYEWVGLYYNDSTGEVSDEPFDNDYDDEDDDIEESVRSKKNKITASEDSFPAYSQFQKDYAWLLKKYPNTRNLYGFKLDGTPQYLFTLTETNYSKQGGKWVVDNTETEDCSIETYFNVFDAIPFFKNLGGTEKVETKSVVGPGHIPVMVTSISPDRTQKTVRQFEIRENPNF